MMMTKLPTFGRRWPGTKATALAAVCLLVATTAAYAPSRTDMADDPAVTGDPLVAAFTAQGPDARLYLPTEKDFSKIDTDIFTPAIQSATQNGDAAAALNAANQQLNQLLGGSC